MLLEFFITRRIKIFCSFQSQFLSCEIAYGFTIHGIVDRPCAWYNLDTCLFTVIELLRTDGLYLWYNDIGLIFTYHRHQSISIKHPEDFALVSHLHSRCLRIIITSYNVLSQTFGSYGKLLTELSAA